MSRSMFSNWVHQFYSAALFIIAFILIFFYRHLNIGMVILGLAWIGKLLMREVRIDKSLLTVSLVLLALVLGASWVIVANQVPGIKKLWVFLLPIVCFLIISSVPVPGRGIRIFPFYFLALIIGKCFYQLIYYRAPHTLTHRLVFFGNPIVYGQMIVMAVIFWLAVILYERTIARAICYSIVFFIGLTGLFFTYARGAWLGFIAALIWLIGSHLKNRLVVILTIILIIFGIGVFIIEPNLANRIGSIFSLTAVTNAQRLVIWKTSLRIFATSPVSGLGFGMFPRYFQKFNHNPLISAANHAHNNLLNILVEFGLIGSDFLAAAGSSHLYPDL